MLHYVVSQVSLATERVDTEKLREQAVLASKIFKADSPEYLYRQAIVAAMQGCRESALGMLFVLQDNKEQGTIKRILDNVSSFDRDIFKKVLAAA